MRVGRFHDTAKNMVDSLFRAEAMADFEAAQWTSVSVKVSTSTAAMLTVLSELFGQSRYAFTGEILEDFTADLFCNLPEDVRRETAEKADKITTELLAKQGVTFGTNIGVAGDLEGESSIWRTNCKIAENPQWIEQLRERQGLI